ncbi:MAG: M48 family metallopeptidase [Paludibacteraceae bacterium]|nr:M48 family metallopeptidase [Paludibacteraceae bacterium]
MTIRIEDIDVEVERKMIRGMRLAVYPPDGRVRMSVPFYISEREVQDFLVQKWQWICRSREKVLARPRNKSREYVSGEQHLFFGKRYTLQVESVSSGTHEVAIEGDQIILRCRPQTTAERREAILYEWYRAQLHLVLEQMVNEWLVRIGEAPVEWSTRRMKSEWGSCIARKRKLLFNLELARVPRECVEYVVVHELTHLAVQNHGPAFKALMTERLPDWKERRKQLRLL